MKPLSKRLKVQVCAVNLSDSSDHDLARVKREYDKMRAIAITLAQCVEDYTDARCQADVDAITDHIYNLLEGSKL
jgi:hypothetical protein